MALQITDANFEELVNSGKPMVLDFWAEFGIRNIPTVLFFKDGKVVDKQVGAAPKTTFVSKIEALL